MTLEEAQERILEQQEQIDNLTTERDSLSQENETLRNDNEGLRTLNQKYFNKLIAQDMGNDDKGTEGDDPVQTCEEFASTLNI